MLIIYQSILLILSISLADCAKFADVYVAGKQIAGQKKGCPCWFDLNSDTGLVGSLACPCCPDGYLPCGYPNYKRCFKSDQYSAGSRVGCKGTAPYSQYTLSTVGGPCPWNHTDFSCAICTADAHVCAPHAEPPKARFKNTEQYCRSYNQAWNYRCWGTTQDCRNHHDICDSNASCVGTGIQVDSAWERYACVCNSGYKGTGYVCVEESSLTNEEYVPNLVDMF